MVIFPVRCDATMTESSFAQAVDVRKMTATVHGLRPLRTHFTMSHNERCVLAGACWFNARGGGNQGPND
jgi:hypothetical protein